VREGLQERELELGEAGRAERRHRRQRCVALFALTSPDRPDLAVQVSSKASSKSASPSKTAPAASGSGSGSTGGTSPSGAASPAAPNGGPYKLVSEYEGDTFFDGWTFWADAGARTFLSLGLDWTGPTDRAPDRSYTCVPPRACPFRNGRRSLTFRRRRVKSTTWTQTRQRAPGSSRRARAPSSWCASAPVLFLATLG